MHSIELDIAGKTDPKQRKDILNDVVEHVLKVANDVLTEREKLEMGQPMLERQDRFIVYFTPGIMKLFTDPTRRALFEAKLIGHKAIDVSSDEAALSDAKERLAQGLEAAVILTQEGVSILQKGDRKTLSKISSIAFDKETAQGLGDLYLFYLAMITNYALLSPLQFHMRFKGPNVVINIDFVKHLEVIWQDVVREYQLKVAA